MRFPGILGFTDASQGLPKRALVHIVPQGSILLCIELKEAFYATHNKGTLRRRIKRESGPISHSISANLLTNV